LQIILPSGRLVGGHFRRNEANPNVSGRELVAYIKRRLRFGEVEDAIVEIVSPSVWRVYLTANAYTIAAGARVPRTHVREASITQDDLERLVAIVDAFGNSNRRMAAYQRLLRPAALRRLMLAVAGTSCQVDGCTASQDFAATWGDPAAGRAVVEVHHIEAIARTLDHHPRNLCVLCANHHRFIHGYGVWQVQHGGPNVELAYLRHRLRLVRDQAVFGPAA